jgi:nucleotide-binding universal stress UspA family protein
MREIAWKKICCPIDFSEESRAALRVAADVARRFGAELTLLHVSDTVQAADPSRLAAWSAGEAEGAPRTETAEAAGDPKIVIAEYANENGFDAIVMGTHGRTGRAHALFGSVAETTVRKARCPVMVVHADWAGLAGT